MEDAAQTSLGVAQAACSASIHSFWNYAYASYPPLTGVLVAALSAFFYTWYFNVRTARNEVLKDYHADLIEIENLCKIYWLGNHSTPAGSSGPDLTMVGHEIRTKLDAFLSLREDYPISIKGKLLLKYKKLETELLMKATGGNFQTNSMTSNPATFAEIFKITHEMKILIRQRRSRKSI